ncbi:MAG: phosphatase PAP2 family protein [Acidobacteria bacterium]|nr:phosphatase PAP2 family protein [Acidobacteriota bacterium]
MNSNLATTGAAGRRVALLLLVFFAFTLGASAQSPQASPSPTPSPTPLPERQFFKNILRDQRAIWTSPFRLEGEDARWLVPLGLTTAALIATDRRTAGALHNDEPRLEASRDVSYAGSLYTASALAAASYFVGRSSSNPRLRETGLLGAEALADSIIVYSALKEVAQRPRPREDGGRGRFFTGGNSFPSGHATNAFAFATVVAEEYKDRPLVRWGAYGIAGLVGVSRFTGRKHFLSDVVVGSAIGYGIGRYVYGTHHDPGLDSSGGETAHKQSKLFPFIAPRYDRGARTYGLELAWSF